MRYFKMLTKPNYLYDFVKEYNLPEDIPYDEFEKECEKFWFKIPNMGGIIIDPNLNLITEDNSIGIYFFKEEDYEYFKTFGKWIIEVFPLDGYPWYDTNEPDIDGLHPCYKAGGLRIGPVMTRTEFERNRR